MAESLSDQVRGILAEHPGVRPLEVATLLGIEVKNAGSLLSYARRSPKKGGPSGRGGNGGAKPTGAQGEPSTPASGHPAWARTTAPLLAFLKASPQGRSHGDLESWRRAESRLNAAQLVNALAWLEGRKLAWTRGERGGDKGPSRAHLVRWFGGTPASGEKDFGDY